MIWEIFRQDRKGQPFEHGGSVEAPDAEVAEAWAGGQDGRRAVYELLGDDADALALDRQPGEYRCAPLVELRLLDWAHTIARRWLYEQADELRITSLMQDDDPEVAGLAAKINREEAYHRMHAE